MRAVPPGPHQSEEAPGPGLVAVLSPRPLPFVPFYLWTANAERRHVVPALPQPLNVDGKRLLAGPLLQQYKPVRMLNALEHLVLLATWFFSHAGT